MGKKASGKSMMDKLPNRKYVTCSWAADTTTACFTQFDTMMGAREGAGWLISRVDVGFKGAVPPQWIFNAGSMRFQLCTGAQVTPLVADDDEVIATLDWSVALATSGGQCVVTPTSWRGPVLVASRELSVVMKGSTNVDPFKNLDMLITIWYNWVKLGAREWVEIAEARGIA